MIDIIETLPESHSAEAAMIAAMMVDSRLIPQILQVVPGKSMLTDDALAIIWDSVIKLYNIPGAVVDGLSVRNDLEQRGQVEAIGGLEYLQAVLDSLPSASSGEYYAKIVRDRAVRRALIAAAGEAARIAREADTAEEAADRIGEVILKASASARSSEHHYTAQEALVMAFGEIERKQKPRVSMPWVKISPLLPGVYAGEMLTIAGRPGHGKTSMALSMLLRNHEHGTGVHSLFISFEMRASDLMLRLVCSMTDIPFNRLRAEDITREEYARVIDAGNTLSQLNLDISDKIPPTPSSVRNMARIIHDHDQLDVVIVDYVQRMRVSHVMATRDREITIISNAMKDLALELDCGVVVLSQLNRACDQREDKRPRLSDLRDSGTLEQDSDEVMMLYRGDCYEMDPSKHNNEATAIIAKNRHGGTGQALLTWKPVGMSFENHMSEGASYDNDLL